YTVEPLKEAASIHELTATSVHESSPEILFDHESAPEASSDHESVPVPLEVAARLQNLLSGQRPEFLPSSLPCLFVTLDCSLGFRPWTTYPVYDRIAACLDPRQCFGSRFCLALGCYCFVVSDLACFDQDLHNKARIWIYPCSPSSPSNALVYGMGMPLFMKTNCP
ncbi:hypothetical protein M9458_048500, partial [Cirrhinus mrigala]